MNEIQTSEWYQAAVSEVSAARTQLFKVAREEMIKAFWEIGKIVLKIENEHEIKRGSGFRKHLAKDVGCSYSYLCQSIQVAEKYPDFELVYQTQEGENISITKLISGPKEKKEKVVCPTCGSKINPEKLSQ